VAQLGRARQGRNVGRVLKLLARKMQRRHIDRKRQHAHQRGQRNDNHA